jgi:hypothetical protein
MRYFLLDNLAVTYIGSGGATATAGLSPVDGKSLKHDKGRFEEWEEW